MLVLLCSCVCLFFDSCCSVALLFTAWQVLSRSSSAARSYGCKFWRAQTWINVWVYATSLHWTRLISKETTISPRCRVQHPKKATQSKDFKIFSTPPTILDCAGWRTRPCVWCWFEEASSGDFPSALVLLGRHSFFQRFSSGFSAVPFSRDPSQKVPARVKNQGSHLLTWICVGKLQLPRCPPFFEGLAMGHDLWLHFGVDEHPFATYVDVHPGFRGF